MSLKPTPFSTIPEETVRLQLSILPRGNTVTRLRDEFGENLTDQRAAEAVRLRVD